MKKTLALASAIAAASCVSVDTDPNETVGAPQPALVEFDPGKSIIPFPNNLLLDRTTGKVNLPAQCGESAAATALRTLVVNALDGFGTFKTAMRITFTKPVDPATLNGNIVLYRRVNGTTPQDPATATAIPLVFIPGKTVRFDASCANPTEIDSVTAVPAQPLAPRGTYTVAVLNGVKSADGADFGISATWGLVRQPVNPVVVENGEIISEDTPLNPYEAEDKATLLGLDLLWKAHAQAIGFAAAAAKRERTEVLLAWEFTTQTTTLPLDPSVATTPAGMVPKAPLSAMVTVASGDPAVSTHMGAVLEGLGAPAGSCGVAALNCSRVGAVRVGKVTTPNYQSLSPSPIGGAMVPGPWSSPVTPTKIGDNLIDVHVFTPAAAMPAGGYPTIVFGHGLGGGRVLSYLIASQLAGAGFATVAIDFVAHGDRAVRISNTGACVDVGGNRPNPLVAANAACYAPIFSTNLAATRDNVRQSVLDVQTLVQSLKLCTVAAPCGGLAVNAAQIGYMGISLGGIIGNVITATTPDLKASVLNVPAVGLVDVLENTQTLAIRCSTVDGLIAAGIITGTPWNKMEGAAATGTCVGDEWKAQPAYLTFSSIARWILDSADGANFAAQVRARRFLIQKVNEDTVVPNSATNTMAALAGLMEQNGDTTLAAPPLNPSPAITDMPKTNKFVKYTNATGFAFSHGSLLTGGTTNEGRLGTVRVQTDAIFYLINNILIP